MNEAWLAGSAGPLKYLVPAARICLEDCRRMAAIFAAHHWTRARPDACTRRGAPKPTAAALFSASWSRQIFSDKRTC
jgi:hypothetical protein